MHLIAVTGMMHQPKATLTQAFASRLVTMTDRLFLIDNSDAPLILDDMTRKRLGGGCVCCSLAASLIPLVTRLDADYALLPVTAAADPEALALVLDSLRGTRTQITTITLIDNKTEERYPYLAQKLTFYSDITLHEPFNYEEAIHATL